MAPLFEKMNLTFFPAEVLEFFYKFLGTIKSDRQKNQHKVKCTQCIAAVDRMLVVDPFFIFCVDDLSLEHKLENQNMTSVCFCLAEPSGLHAVDGRRSGFREQQRRSKLAKR